MLINKILYSKNCIFFLNLIINNSYLTLRLDTTVFLNLYFFIILSYLQITVIIMLVVCYKFSSKGGGGGGGGRQVTRTRARIVRSSTSNLRGRGGTGVIMGGNSSGSGSRTVISAPYVPEELVTQAQVVLQGKSRNLIIRELQVLISNNYTKKL